MPASNWQRVLVELNKPADALMQLDVLLHSDLPGYLWKIKHDPIFNYSVESDFFGRLQLMIEQRTALWEQQIKQGWPMGLCMAST